MIAIPPADDCDPLYVSVILTLPLFLQLAAAHAPSVAPETLAAFAQNESGLNPNAVHDNTTGLTTYPETAAAAMELATSLLAQGHSLDLGIMQINSANFVNTGLTVAAAFDPGLSLRAGAQILVAAYQQCRRGGQIAPQAALRCAASVYNTGREQAGILNGYQARVWRAAAQIVPAIQTAGIEPGSQPQSATADDVVAPRPHLHPPVLEDALHPAPPVSNDNEGMSDALHLAHRKDAP
jgi:type IV secretion system protein VirB1